MKLLFFLFLLLTFPIWAILIFLILFLLVKLIIVVVFLILLPFLLIIEHFTERGKKDE